MVILDCCLAGRAFREPLKAQYTGRKQVVGACKPNALTACPGRSSFTSAHLRAGRFSQPFSFTDWFKETLQTAFFAIHNRPCHQSFGDLQHEIFSSSVSWNLARGKLHFAQIECQELKAHIVPASPVSVGHMEQDYELVLRLGLDNFHIYSRTPETPVYKRKCALIIHRRGSRLRAEAVAFILRREFNFDEVRCYKGCTQRSTRITIGDALDSIGSEDFQLIHVMGSSKSSFLEGK